MDGAVERDIPEHGVAFYVLPREEDDGFGTVVIDGFDALRRIGFQQLDGRARREVGVLARLQDRKESRFKHGLCGGTEMPAVCERFVLWPGRRWIELVRLADTDILRKQEIRSQRRFGAFGKNGLLVVFHFVKGMEIKFEDLGLLGLKRVTDDNQAGLDMDDFAQGGVQGAGVCGGGVSRETVEMVVMEEACDFSFGLPSALFALSVVKRDAAFCFGGARPLIMMRRTIVVVMPCRDGERFAESFEREAILVVVPRGDGAVGATKWCST